MTFAVDYQKPVNPGDTYSRFQRTLASVDQQLVNNQLSRALTFAGRYSVLRLFTGFCTPARIAWKLIVISVIASVQKKVMAKTVQEIDVL